MCPGGCGECQGVQGYCPATAIVNHARVRLVYSQENFKLSTCICLCSVVQRPELMCGQQQDMRQLTTLVSNACSEVLSFDGYDTM